MHFTTAIVASLAALVSAERVPLHH